MSWRTVVISSRCKLDLKMGYMVIRGETTQRVFLDELAVVMIENPTVALTGCLLEALAEKKVRVIFCDNKRSPYGELAPYYGSYDCSRKMKQQAGWTEAAKKHIWASVIWHKIRLQAEHLEEVGKLAEAAMLRGYMEQLMPGDTTNREGHAAKVYFNALFGLDFKRQADTPVNAALNYGYGIILSAFNRAITNAGYSTLLGIHHDNVFNFYNLSSDIMEPYRILIDRCVKCTDIPELNNSVKYTLVDVLNQSVFIDGSKQTVLNAIDIYTRSILRAVCEDDVNLIKYYCL